MNGRFFNALPIWCMTEGGFSRSAFVTTRSWHLKAETSASTIISVPMSTPTQRAPCRGSEKNGS